MIISTIDPDDYWSCLIRRGMLHSETEAIEHWILTPGQELRLGTQRVHEALLLLSGAAAFAGETLAAGNLLLAHSEQSGTLTATTTTEVLSIRTYPEHVTRALPARIPELPEAERAI
ncbi:hypothetical protein [Arthrobacter sp. efr-133-R2A-120]|uniref:hypothetical protein n=1 Tax=Arthrobacter sp. efr-133-R2A-120 TaxID=3040277 RepID=UPI00254AFA67|nr:hypothetical protein [Arthrobacter sp. efr-133-R2A-120]